MDIKANRLEIIKIGKDLKGFMNYEITAIEVQKKDAERCSVFINGEFGFGISKKAVERYGLIAGSVLGEDEYQALMMRLQLDKAKFKALDSISRGGKTEKQIKEKLLEAEYSTYIVDEVLAFLKKYNYINDDDYARRYIDAKSQYSHKSLRQIKAELYKKGISVTDLTMYCEDPDTLEQENIDYFLEKYRYDGSLELKDRQKIINRILTKGFSYSNIERCIRKKNEGFDA